VNKDSEPWAILKQLGYADANKVQKESFEYAAAVELATGDRAAKCCSVAGRSCVTHLNGVSFTQVVRYMLEAGLKHTPPDQEAVSNSHRYVRQHMLELQQFLPALQPKVSGQQHCWLSGCCSVESRVAGWYHSDLL
jgi:hypothetical protein